MSSAIRWSEKDLQQYLAKTSTAKNYDAIKETFSQAKGNSIETRKKKSVVEKFKDTVQDASISGNHAKGKFLEIQIQGCKLLSHNQVLALHHFQRIAYRKTIQDLIRGAVLQITAGPRNIEIFHRFRVTAKITSPRGLDVDAINSYFKYPIDALRYNNILLDDSPEHMVSIRTTQSKGPYAIVLRIDAVVDDEPYVNEAFAGVMPS